ncbi:MAG: hypothetical protein ABH950_04360 [Candidatus Altiarchaeota archaeon]
MHKKIILGVVLLLLFLSGLAGAVSIRDIEVNNGKPVTLSKKEGIYQVKDFDFDIMLSGDTCGTQLVLYIDDEEYETLNPGCGDPDDDEKKVTKEWLGEREEPLGCGEHELKVELLRADRVTDSKSVDFSVGNLPEIRFTPEMPENNDPVRITFYDGGSPVSGIKFTIIYNNIEEVESASSGSGGSYTFTPDKRGRYRLKIEDTRYCGDVNFFAKSPIMVSGPFPAFPVVGELITIGVPPGVGVKVADSSGDICVTCENREGGANFTLDTPGEYTIVIGELSTKFWGQNISFTVSERPPLELEVTPEKMVAKKQVVFKLSSRGVPIEGAKLVVTKPDGSVKSFVSSESGQVYYTEASDVGKYSISVDKSRFSSVTKDFEVKNSFTVKVSPENPLIGQRITFKVQDQLGKPVSNAKVEVSQADYSTQTSAEGEASVVFEDRLEYDVVVSKADYWDNTLKLTPFGLLSLDLSSREVELGDIVHISVSGGADLEITLPDSSSESVSVEESIEYEAKTVGVYRLRATKPDHVSSTEEFKVRPHPLSANFSISDKRIILEVQSNGNPLSDLKVGVSTPQGKESKLTTNQDGRVIYLIDEDGRYLFFLNSEGENAEFEQKVAAGEVYKERDYLIIFSAYLVIILFAAVLLGLSVVLHKKQKHKFLDKETYSGPKPKSAFDPKTKRRGRLGRN